MRLVKKEREEEEEGERRRDLHDRRTDCRFDSGMETDHEEKKRRCRACRTLAILFCVVL